MQKIKDLFNKKKGDLTFKKAGPGYRLNDNASQRPTSSTSSSGMGRILGSGQSIQSNESQPKRHGGPDENVAKATLARLETRPNSTTTTTSVNKSTLYDIMAEEKQKFEKELKMKDDMEEKRRLQQQQQQEQLKQMENPFKEFEEAQRFTCQTLDINDSIPFKDIIRQIKSSIYDNFTDDPVLRSAMIVFNCNRSIDDGPNNGGRNVRLQNCLDILLKIVSNLLNAENNEQLEKFKRVRRSKIEQKVLSLDGTLDFMFAIGFTIDDKDSDWLVYVNDDDEAGRKAKMTYLKDLISNPQIIPIELDRQVKLIDQSIPVDVESDDQMTSANIKEYHSNLERTRQIEEMFISRETKAKLLVTNPNLSNYRSIFTKLRFKFELTGEMQLIEAVFYSQETLADVKKWFLEQYGNVCDGQSVQFKQGLSLLTNENDTLDTLKLSPASTLLAVVVH